MSNNVTSNPGAGGYVFATRDVSGVHHPLSIIEQVDASGVPAPVSPTNPLLVLLSDIAESVRAMFRWIANPVWADPTSGRLRVVLDATGGAQTLGTVTTLTSMSQVAGVAANSFIYDTMHAAWAHAVRPRVT